MTLRTKTLLALAVLATILTGCQFQPLPVALTQESAQTVADLVRADLQKAYKDRLAAREAEPAEPAEPTEPTDWEAVEDVPEEYEDDTEPAEPELFEPPDTSAVTVPLEGTEDPLPGKVPKSVSTTAGTATGTGLRAFPAGYTVRTYSQVACPPCKAFKDITLSRLPANIVECLEYTPDELSVIAASKPNLVSVPYTELLYNGQMVHWFRGSTITAERIREAVDEHINRPTATPVKPVKAKATTVYAAAPVKATPTYSYSMSWHLPDGDYNPSKEKLIQHLTQPPHYNNRAYLQTLDIAQLKQIHDRDHGTSKPLGTTTYRPAQTQTYRPVQTQTYRPAQTQTYRPVQSYRKSSRRNYCPTCP